MGYSGARGTLIYEKNLMLKFSLQTPFKQLSRKKFLCCNLINLCKKIKFLRFIQVLVNIREKLPFYALS
jgi:hypothetical protein